jgi:hypothetical protein
MSSSACCRRLRVAPPQEIANHGAPLELGQRPFPNDTAVIVACPRRQTGARMIL